MARLVWSKRIAALSDNLRVTHADLAGLVGVDQATVWRWINDKGSPPSHVTQRVVEALERIVAIRRVDDFFTALHRHHIQPRSRQMLEVIFQFSAERSFA